MSTYVQMKLGTMLKIFVLGWMPPMAMVVMLHLFTPDPSLPKESYPSATFVPSNVQVIEKKESRGADYFELWLHNPNGESYFHRDPNPGPISDLKKKIPQEVPLKVIYSPTKEGNVLFEIRAFNSEEESALPFEKTVGEHAFRRRVVQILAGVWLTIGVCCFLAAWCKGGSHARA